MKNDSRPYGFLSNGDIAQFTALKGQQVHRFLLDHGVNIDGRLYIREAEFRRLMSEGEVDRYRGFKMWSDQIRKSNYKKNYKRWVGNDAES